MPSANHPAAADYPPRADMSPMADLFDEARRQLSVCNACRYCAGYCPVWPELELRTVLSDGDLGFLGNLCHDCQDCFTACMYTAPHEFAINPPQVFAGLREDSYRRYAWPDRLPRWLAGWRGTVAAIVAVAVLFGALSYAATGRALPAAPGHHGSPYQILPYALMLILLGLPALWCAAVLAVAAVRCWRDIHGPLADLARLRHWPAAIAQAVQLRHMRGTVSGADSEVGCDYPADASSTARRRFHLILSYGFIGCVASTVSAAIEQDLLNIAPPYPYLSVPVLTGTLGGLGMLAGGAGLLILKARSDPARGTPGMRRSDYALLLALLVLAATGLLTLAVRDTALFGPVLTAHLAAIAVAFAVAPYTKFTHWLYRLLAIYKHNFTGTAADQGLRRPRLSPAVGSVLGEDLTEWASCGHCLSTVVVHRVGTGDERLPERPATPAGPCRIIHRKPLPERLPALAGQQRPGDCQVTCRVTDTAGSEVDDRRQLPVIEQEISLGNVTVEPALHAIPAGVKGARPDLAGHVDIDVTVQHRQRILHQRVVSAQRAAAEPVVLSGAGTVSRFDGPQSR
jgi:citrate/tricarballylate utilization protein